MAIAVLLSAGAVAAVTWARPTLPKADFIARADAICAPANAAVTALTLPKRYEELTAAAGTVAAALDAEKGALGQLGRPDGADGKAAGAVIAGMRATSKAAKALKAVAAARNDAGTAQATTTFAAQFNATTASARALGLSACAVGLQPGVDLVYAGARSILRGRFVKLAEPACTAVFKGLADVGNPENRAQFIDLIDRIITTWDKFQLDLSVLPVPPGDEQTVKDLIASISAAGARMHEARGAVNRYDGAAFSTAWDSVLSLLDAADGKIVAYGLGACGDPGAP